jgi:hypothetical protein
MKDPKTIQSPLGKARTYFFFIGRNGMYEVFHHDCNMPEQRKVPIQKKEKGGPSESEAPESLDFEYECDAVFMNEKGWATRIVLGLQMIDVRY